MSRQQMNEFKIESYPIIGGKDTYTPCPLISTGCKQTMNAQEQQYPCFCIEDPKIRQTGVTTVLPCRRCCIPAVCP